MLSVLSFDSRQNHKTFCGCCMFYLEYAFIHLACVTVIALEASAVDELGIIHFVVYFSHYLEMIDNLVLFNLRLFLLAISSILHNHS